MDAFGKSEKTYTLVGTNIEEVKKKNAQSGLSFNEVKAILAQQGGYHTKMYSTTSAEDVRQQLKQSKQH